MVLSDDARQLNVGRHALCSVHAERLVHKLDTFTDRHHAAQTRVRGLIWDFYADLKAYRLKQSPRRAVALREQFDRIFLRRTGFARRRVEHCSHLILREQECSVPSSAIGTRPSRNWNGASGSTISIAFINSPPNAAGEAAQHHADVAVGGDRRNAEPGLAVRPIVPPASAC
jgi:hypothetical protein